MKLLKTIIIGILFLIAAYSCTTIKNGYSENFRKTTVQRAIVITSTNPKKDRVYYDGYSIPSGIEVNFWDWIQKREYQKNDTVLVSYSLYKRIKWEL